MTSAFASDALAARAPAGPPSRSSSGLDGLPVLVVPGLNDSGPGHWQSRWLDAHRRFRRVVQPDFATPDLNRWAATVAMAVDRCPSPPLVIAHSYGCLATLRAGYLFERPFAGALLVAPADPDRFGVLTRLPARPLPYPSILVASSDDPWLKLTKAGLLATRWGSELVALAGVGHLNVDSGHGPWPDGLRLLRRLAARANAAARAAAPRPLAAASPVERIDARGRTSPRAPVGSGASGRCAPR